MNSWKELSCMATMVLATAAHADIVTPNLTSPRLHADVSNSFPGLALRKLKNQTGAYTYSPVVSSAMKMPCTWYAACGYLSQLQSIGGSLMDTNSYQICYNQWQIGETYIPSCFNGFEVIEGTFTNPTDFVEFEFTWITDAPATIGYDGSGNEIMSCHSWGSSGIPAGCATTYTLSPGGEFIGKVRLSTTNAVIKRVVAGSRNGSSRLVGLQYSRLQ